MVKQFDLTKKLRSTLTDIKTRCSNPNHRSYPNYGGRGIRCYLSLDDLQFLWRRDRAADLNWPTVDRIDNDGHYVLTNCHFIELSENVRKGNMNPARALNKMGFTLRAICGVLKKVNRPLWVYEIVSEVQRLYGKSLVSRHVSALMRRHAGIGKNQRRTVLFSGTDVVRRSDGKGIQYSLLAEGPVQDLKLSVAG